MRNCAKCAVVATIAGLLAVSVATPSFARARRHHHGMHHYYVMHRGYAAYGFVRGGRDFGSRNERDCMRSPSSLRFTPCMNRP